MTIRDLSVVFFFFALPFFPGLLIKRFTNNRANMNSSNHISNLVIWIPWLFLTAFWNFFIGSRSLQLFNVVLGLHFKHTKDARSEMELEITDLSRFVCWSRL